MGRVLATSCSCCGVRNPALVSSAQLTAVDVRSLLLLQGNYQAALFPLIHICLHAMHPCHLSVLMMYSCAPLHLCMPRHCCWHGPSNLVCKHSWLNFNALSCMAQPQWLSVRAIVTRFRLPTSFLLHYPVMWGPHNSTQYTFLSSSCPTKSCPANSRTACMSMLEACAALNHIHTLI